MKDGCSLHNSGHRQSNSGHRQSFVWYRLVSYSSLHPVFFNLLTDLPHPSLRLQSPKQDTERSNHVNYLLSGCFITAMDTLSIWDNQVSKHHLADS